MLQNRLSWLAICLLGCLILSACSNRYYGSRYASGYETNCMPPSCAMPMMQQPVYYAPPQQQPQPAPLPPPTTTVLTPNMSSCDSGYVPMSSGSCAPYQSQTVSTSSTISTSVCPTGYVRMASGACEASLTSTSTVTACQSGYVRMPSGNCEPSLSTTTTTTAHTTPTVSCPLGQFRSINGTCMDLDNQPYTTSGAKYPTSGQPRKTYRVHRK